MRRDGYFAHDSSDGSPFRQPPEALVIAWILLPALIATTDFGSVVRGTRSSGAAKEQRRADKRRKRKRKRKHRHR